jgi:DNA-binding NarL/FixJ family response regulator
MPFDVRKAFGLQVSQFRGLLGYAQLGQSPEFLLPWDGSAEPLPHIRRHSRITSYSKLFALNSVVSNMTQEITIVLADDHPILRQGLRQLIEQKPGLRIVGEAADGRRALELVETHQPEIALLDLDMPELDGFSVARRVRELGLATKIVILTMHKDELHFRQAIDLGVRGYVMKDSAVSEVIDCLRTVAKDRVYFSPSLSSFLLQRARRSQAATQTGIDELTPTERRVLVLLADLRTTKEIAAELGVSPRTIDNHRAHICSKLNLQGSHALVKFALLQKDALR